MSKLRIRGAEIEFWKECVIAALDGGISNSPTVIRLADEAVEVLRERTEPPSHRRREDGEAVLPELCSACENVYCAQGLWKCNHASAGERVIAGVTDSIIQTKPPNWCPRGGEIPAACNACEHVDKGVNGYFCGHNDMLEGAIIGTAAPGWCPLRKNKQAKE